MGCSGSKPTPAEPAEPEVVEMLVKFCKFGSDVTDYCTPDCTLNPPGVPPVAFDKVPEIMKTECLANPVEVGTYTIVDGKVKCAAYAIDSDKGHAMTGKGSPAVEAAWGKKGDGSDVGFGAYFKLMGVDLPPPPKEAPAHSVASTAVYDVAPAKAWKVVSDWAAPYITEANSPAALCNLVGKGVGATRTVKMLDGSAEWSEKVTAFDADGMTWSYVCTSPLPAPFNAFDIASFVCTFAVKPVKDDADKSEITIGAKYDLAKGCTEAPPIEPMYAGWAAAAAECAKKGDVPA